MEEKAGFELGKKYEVTLTEEMDYRRQFNTVQRFIAMNLMGNLYSRDFDSMEEVLSSSKARLAVAWSSALYKVARINLDSAQKAKLGTVLEQFQVKDRTFNYDFWHCLDWERGDFGDNGSCYWGERINTRKIMLTDPDFVAIRFYSPVKTDYFNQGDGIARAIIHSSEDFYTLFNLYTKDGPQAISYLSAARVLSQHLHNTYTLHHKADIVNCHSTSGMLWINAAGYLVPKEKSFFPSLPDNYDLNREDIYNARYGGPLECSHCGCEIDTEWEYDGHYYCEDCYYEVSTFICSICGDMFDRDDEMNCYDGDELCDTCYEALPRCQYSLKRFAKGVQTMSRLSGAMFVPTVRFAAHEFSTHICHDLVEGVECCEEHHRRFGATCPNCHTNYMLIEIIQTSTEVPAPGGRTRKVYNTSYLYNPALPCPNCQKETTNEQSESRYTYA